MTELKIYKNMFISTFSALTSFWSAILNSFYRHFCAVEKKEKEANLKAVFLKTFSYHQKEESIHVQELFISINTGNKSITE